MTPLRVAIVADMLEERWPSMDLVADMLTRRLRADYAGRIEATLFRPPMRRRATSRDCPETEYLKAARSIGRSPAH